MPNQQRQSTEGIKGLSVTGKKTGFGKPVTGSEK